MENGSFSFILYLYSVRTALQHLDDSRSPPSWTLPRMHCIAVLYCDGVFWSIHGTRKKRNPDFSVTFFVYQPFIVASVGRSEWDRDGYVGEEFPDSSKIFMRIVASTIFSSSLLHHRGDPLACRPEEESLYVGRPVDHSSAPDHSAADISSGRRPREQSAAREMSPCTAGMPTENPPDHGCWTDRRAFWSHDQVDLRSGGQQHAGARFSGRLPYPGLGDDDLPRSIPIPCHRG